MVRLRLIALSLVSVLLFTSSMATAQQVAAGEAARWREVAERLEPAAFISLRLKDGTRMKGTVIGVSDTALSFKPKTRIPVPARDVPFEEVVSIERERQGMNPGQKVLAGAAGIVGGTILVVVLLLANLE